MRLLPLSITSIKPGDTVVIHAELSVTNDTNEKTSLDGLFWEPRYESGPAEKPSSIES